MLESTGSIAQHHGKLVAMLVQACSTLVFGKQFVSSFMTQKSSCGCYVYCQLTVCGPAVCSVC